MWGLSVFGASLVRWSRLPTRLTCKRHARSCAIPRPKHTIVHMSATPRVNVVGVRQKQVGRVRELEDDGALAQQTSVFYKMPHIVYMMVFYMILRLRTRHTPIQTVQTWRECRRRTVAPAARPWRLLLVSPSQIPWRQIGKLAAGWLCGCGALLPAESILLRPPGPDVTSSCWPVALPLAQSGRRYYKYNADESANASAVAIVQPRLSLQVAASLQ